MERAVSKETLSLDLYRYPCPINWLVSLHVPELCLIGFLPSFSSLSYPIRYDYRQHENSSCVKHSMKKELTMK